MENIFTLALLNNVNLFPAEDVGQVPSLQLYCPSSFTTFHWGKRYKVPLFSKE